MCFTAAVELAVRGAARTRFPDLSPPAYPEVLAEWIDQDLPGILGQECGGQECSEADRLAACAVAIDELYGDPSCPRPAADLVAAQGLCFPVTCRTVERAFVRYLLPPNGGDPAPRALGVLSEWVRRLIRPTLRWYRSRLFSWRDLPEDRDEWLQVQEDDCVPMICAYLLGGCSCWEEVGTRLGRGVRDRDIGAAERRCETTHSLAGWDPDGCETLHWFLCNAVVGGCVSLTTAEPQIHAHRTSILAAVALEGKIYARKIPKHSRPEGEPRCPGEIDPETDHCRRCGRLTELRQAPYGLFHADRPRQVRNAKRCGTSKRKAKGKRSAQPRQDCDVLYFRFHCPCPRDAGHTWSSDPTELWCRSPGNVQLEEHNRAAPGPSPADEAVLAEQRGWLQNYLATQPPVTRHNLAQDLFGHRVEFQPGLHAGSQTACDNLAAVLRGVVPQAERQRFVENQSPELLRLLALRLLVNGTSLAAILVEFQEAPHSLNREQIHSGVRLILRLALAEFRGETEQHENAEDTEDEEDES